MAQAMINFSMDEELKRSKERRTPFEVAADQDPFYSDANMSRLRTAIADMKERRNVAEHELIEVEEVR